MKLYRRYILYISICLGLLISPFCSGSAEAKDFVVVIDPGHGGHDPGAVGKISKEKNINLNVALKLGKQIKKNCPDVKVIYTRDRDDFIFVVLRECTPDKRKQIIDYMLANMEGIGLVIIDGIRDLMYDINSPSESSELINLLMRWSSEYNLHIHTVLHLNKGDDNTRGHIGTELNNKAETVLQITKSTQDVDISEVKAMHIRDKDFEPFAFRINETALPEVVKDYVFEQPKQNRNFPLTELTEQQHREALENGFGKDVVQGYPNVIAALKKGYASIGFERGRNILVDLNKFLVNKRMIIKEGKGYKFNSDFHY